MGKENDGAGGEGDADAAAAAAAAAGENDGNDNPGGDDAPKGYRPEGLADEYAGATDQETIDKLYEGLNKATARAEDLRGKLGERKGVPKDASEYGTEFTYSDGFIEKHGNPAPKDDPILGILREKALEAGVTVDAFQKFVPGVLEAAAEAGLLEAPYDVAAEFEKAGGKDAYERTRTELNTRLDGLMGQGKITEAQRKEAEVFTATADGQGLVKALFSLAAEKGVVTDDGGDASGSVRSMADVRARMDDPRYDSKSPQFSQAFVDETRAMARKLQGG